MLGAKLGLDLEKLLNVVTAGAAGSWMLSNLGPKMIKRDFEPGFRISHQQKDLREGFKSQFGNTLTCILPYSSRRIEFHYPLADFYFLEVPAVLPMMPLITLIKPIAANPPMISFLIASKNSCLLLVSIHSLKPGITVESFNFSSSKL